MFHAIATFIFALIFLKWISFEFKKSANFKKNIWWLIAAMVLQIFVSFLALAIGGKYGNLLLHSLGGGASSTLLFFYFLKTFDYQFTWRLEFVVLFAFVSTLGVLNELAEYAYELLHLGTLSFDPHDTWRDLLANSVGAITAWLIIRLVYRFRAS